MKSTLKTVLIGTLLTASFGLAAAPTGGCLDGSKMRDHQREKMGLHGRHWDKIGEKLHITDEQRAAMRSVRDEAAPQFRQLREKMKENRKQLRALNRQEGHDAARVAELAQEQGSLQAARIVLRSEVKSKLRGVLTEQQRDQIDKMRAARGDRR